MSAARGDFYPAIRVMWDLTNQPLLTDKGAGEVAHNLSAGALRRGLAVNAFALLETYLEARLGELLIILATSQWGYASFSDDLRKLLTLNATIGLATKVGFAPKSDKLALAERGIKGVSAYSSTPPVYTSFGFSPKGSNVYKDDVSGCLTALGSSAPWPHMASIASATGSTRVDIANDFKNIAQTRHDCAHKSKTSIPTVDLQSHLELVSLIGLAFDVISTTLVRRLHACKKASDVKLPVPTIPTSFRFLDHEIDGSWSERPSLIGKSVKNYPLEADGRTGLLGRANAATDFRILRNVQKIPLELF